VLDLADTPVAKASPPFNKCTSVPIVRGDEVVGAFAVYSVGAAEFTADDASAVQAVADQIVVQPE
jgi:GAF domain-containing protein